MKMKKRIAPLPCPSSMELTILSEGATNGEAGIYFFSLLVDGSNEVSMRTLSCETKDYIGLRG